MQDENNQNQINQQNEAQGDVQENAVEEKKIPLDSIIESLLFFKAEPLSFSWFSKQLGKTEEEIKSAVDTLKLKLENRGLAITQVDNKILLTTSVGVSEMIKELRKEELTKDLSKAALETLSVVLYREHVSRADIDFIRGVNSSFILRNLLVRGLIERQPHPQDSRRYVYAPSFDTMSFMGVTKREELPNFENVVKTLQEKLDGITKTKEE